MKTSILLIVVFMLSFLSLGAQNEFITTWQTDNPGTSNNNQITIPTFSGETYNYIVDWGDGNTDTGVTGDITHSYTSQGTYTVTITGLFPRIYFNNSGDKDKILTIEQWGSNPWSTMNRAFYGCGFLNIINPTIDTPNLSNVTEAYDMFRDAFSFTGDYMSNWDVSNIENMDYMFRGTNNFNGDIGLWDVGNVTTMFAMFQYAFTFNQDIGDWDVSNVTSMRNMFFNSYLFNQDIGDWNVAEVKSMRGMFSGAISFNQDIGNWDVSEVTEMASMFNNSVNFDQNLGNWDISKVIDMQGMFLDCTLSTAHYDAIIFGWATDTSGNVSDGIDDIPMNIIFSGGNSRYCASENSRNILDVTHNWTFTDGGLEANCFITTWKTDNIGESNDNQITIPTFLGEAYNYAVNWGDGNSDIGVTGDITHTYASPGIYTVSITGLFPRIYFHEGLKDREKILTIEQWGTNPWSSMVFAFSFCKYLDITNPNIDSPNLSQATNLAGMFNHCYNFNGDLTGWDVSTITSMQVMFRESRKFNQDISNWDVSNVVNMVSMFEGADDFEQDIGGWDITDLNNASGMFATTEYSYINYDKLLIGWSTDSSGDPSDGIDDIPSDITFTGGSSAYCFAESEREDLIVNHNWTITDAGQKPACMDGFITTWNTTDFSGITNSDEITIPTFSGETYNYNVDWGDGTSDTGLTGDITHTYPNEGTYTVLINGVFPRIYVNGSNVRQKLLSIEQWGNMSWQSMENAFFGCDNMIINALDTPDLSNVVNMNRMFDHCVSLNSDLSTWDVSNVQTMNNMFAHASSFNQDIGGWNVSNVQTMNNMFVYATSFNHEIGAWDISNITNMNNIFQNAELSTSNYDATLMGWATDSSGNPSDGIDDIPSNINFNGGASTYCISEMLRNELNTTYNWTITDGGLDCTISLSPKAYLQGAYNSADGYMRDDLRVAGLITTDTPYTDGKTILQSVLNVSGLDAIVDWVWIELRDENDNTNVIDSQSALLQRDGDVVDIDGVSPLSFNQVSDAYYVVISHRNHLGIITANTVSLSGSLTTLDLFSDSTLIDGGENAVIEIGEGIFALYAGDFDGNGQVQNADLTDIRPLLGQPASYNNADLDMNGQVQTTDINNLLNPNTGKGQQFARMIDLKLFAKRKQ